MITILAPLIVLVAVIALIGSASSNELKERRSMIKLVYTVFLAIMVALFVGLGVQTFYPAPKMPEWPTELQFAKGDPSTYTADQQAIQRKFDQEQKDYRDQNKKYSLNASIIIVIASIVLLSLSLTLLHPLILISDGVLMGGVFTLLYGIIRGFMSENDKYQFVVITLGLIIAITLGYIRFTKPEKAK